MKYKIGDKVRFIDSMFYAGGYIKSLGPFVITSFGGETVTLTNLDNLELWEDKGQFIGNRRHNKGNRHQLGHELEHRYTNNYE